VDLDDKLDRIATAARAYLAEDEELEAVIPAEPAGEVVYLCAFAIAGGRSWVVLDAGGQALTDRVLVHDAVTIAALCELAEESAVGGRLEQLRADLDELERLEGVDVGEARGALAALETTLQPPPRVASPAYLDGIGAATREVERALGEIGTSPFVEAMKRGSVAVEGLAAEVEGSYKLPLS
jgi:hypothetical protein